MKKSNFKKIISCNSNQYFDVALSSSELRAITGGNSSDADEKDYDSCGCNGCANLCCSGFGDSCPNLA